MFEEEIPLSQHDRLAMAIAQGKSIAEWAQQNGVPRRTRRRPRAEKSPVEPKPVVELASEVTKMTSKVGHMDIEQTRFFYLWADDPCPRANLARSERVVEACKEEENWRARPNRPGQSERANHRRRRSTGGRRTFHRPAGIALRGRARKFRGPSADGPRLTRLGLPALGSLTKVRHDSGRESTGAIAREESNWEAGEPRKGVVRMGRWISTVVLAAAMAPSWGCAHGPRRFRKVENPAPVVRARAVGLGRRQPDSQLLPALVTRLGDTDPVVRLAAFEELHKRTGQDFGYVPWASPEERSSRGR